jgi:hypothetical protein
LLTFTVDTLPVPSNTELNCYIKYLKTGNKLDESYREFDIENEASEALNCEEVIETLKRQLYEENFSKLNITVLSEDLASKVCLISIYESQNLADDTMLEFVYESNLIMPEVEKEEKLIDIRRKTEEDSLVALQTCGVGKIYKELEFEDRLKTFSESDDEMFHTCATKYVNDHSSIDTKLYNIDVNTNELVDDECTQLFQQKFEAIKEEKTKYLKFIFTENKIKEEEMQCYIEHQAASNLAFTLRIEVLSKLQLTDEQKEKEKKRYVEDWSKSTFSGCFRVVRV